MRGMGVDPKRIEFRLENRKFRRMQCRVARRKIRAPHHYLGLRR